MQLVPYYRYIFKDYFINPELIRVQMVKVGDLEYPTAPLAIGVRVNLISVSMDRAMVDAGILGATDQISSQPKLKAVYYREPGSDVVSVLHTQDNDSATFVHLKNGHWRTLILLFKTDVGIRLVGNVNTELGTCIVAVASDSNPNYEVLGYELDCERGQNPYIPPE